MFLFTSTKPCEQFIARGGLLLLLLDQHIMINMASGMCSKIYKHAKLTISAKYLLQVFCLQILAPFQAFPLWERKRYYFPSQLLQEDISVSWVMLGCCSWSSQWRHTYIGNLPALRDQWLYKNIKIQTCKILVLNLVSVFCWSELPTKWDGPVPLNFSNHT